jgi:DNA-binding MarR family transcriptional regulator
MATKLSSVVRQARTFPNVEAEVFVTLSHLHAGLHGEMMELLRSAGISTTQYNILRVLAAAGRGLSGREISDRLITRDPDMTRLLDRLEKQALVTREREGRDRRVVTVRITPAGADLLAQLEEPIAGLHRHQLGHMSPARLRQLLSLLEEAMGMPAT